MSTNAFYDRAMRRGMRVLLMLFLVLEVVDSRAEDRFALLVGNSDYEEGGRLANPEKDVDALSASLQPLGFDVSVAKNVDQEGFDNALNKFERKLTLNSIALFFYAGHGFEVDGENYLLPLRHGIESKREVSRKCISVSGIVQMLEESKTNLRLVVLDSCRNNPFERSWSRGTSVRGFASVQPPDGTIIAFATAPGEMANDGEGKNSPFTSSLVKALNAAAEEPVEIQRLFRFVGQECKRLANQRPYIDADSSMSDYFLGVSTIVTAESQQRQPKSMQKPSESDVPRSQTPGDTADPGERGGRLGVVVLSSLSGPVVIAVHPNSPATRCLSPYQSDATIALNVGDRIEAINGSSMSDAVDAITAINASPPAVSLQIKQLGGKVIHVSTELNGKSKTEKRLTYPTQVGFAKAVLKDAGVLVGESIHRDGLQIVGVISNSLAAKIEAESLPTFGYKKSPVSGCVAITHINNYRVRTLADADRVITNDSERLKREIGPKTLFLSMVDHQKVEYCCYFVTAR